MKSVRIRFAGLFAGFAALSLLTGAASAKAASPAKPTPTASADASKPAQPTETKDFGDWTVRCYSASAGTPCEMIELLVNKKSGRRVLGVLIVYNPSNNQNVMQVAMPLGVMLQNGAVLNADTYTSGVLHYRLCDMQGCYALTALDDGAIKALGRATKAQVNIVSADGKKFDIGFSLNGFTAAHSALMDMTRKAPPPVAPSAPPGQ